MNYSFHSVSAAKINLHNETYRITTRTDTTDLVPSIRSTGMINPPILIDNSGGFIVASGFRRIASCQKIGRPEFEAKILPSDTQTLTCAKLAIADNASQRPLNLIEMSRALNLLSRLLTDRVEFEKTASDLGLPDSFSLIQKILKLCHLPEPIQSGVLAEDIALAMALELGEFDDTTATALVTIFRELRLGLNRQREVLTLLTEIAHRRNCSILDMTEGRDIKGILNSQEFDTARKSHRIQSYLRRQRYPHIVEKTEKFKKIINSVGLGPGIQLHPPKNFEGTAYTVTLSFRHLAELDERKRYLDKLILDPDLKQFLDS